MTIDDLYQIFKSSKGVTTDSRNCPKGSLFFALKGETFDGNVYAEMSLGKGCSYAIVDDASVVKDERFILVDDVLSTLQSLANHHRKTLATPIIGITGSNGKTTTKELLAVVLMKKFNLHYTHGNFNNHIGVPLTLLQLKENHDMAIVEMGANHPGEIGELCAIAEPDWGIITNIGKAHLEGFGGIEGVIKTKKELYDFIRSHQGKLFVNGSDELLLNLSEGIERAFYNDDASAYSVVVSGAIPTLTLDIDVDGELKRIQTQMVGEYNRINVSVVLEVGHSFGIPFEDMKEALEAYVPSNNRSQIIKTSHNQVVLDAYNANPASMSVAIENFMKLDMPNKVVLLGAMKEMGEYSIAEHQALVDDLKLADFALKVVVGEEFLAISNRPSEVMFFETIDELKVYLDKSPLKDATVLVKGSRSMKMETLVELL